MSLIDNLKTVLTSATNRLSWNIDAIQDEEYNSLIGLISATRIAIASSREGRAVLLAKSSVEPTKPIKIRASRPGPKLGSKASPKRYIQPEELNKLMDNDPYFYSAKPVFRGSIMTNSRKLKKNPFLRGYYKTVASLLVRDKSFTGKSLTQFSIENLKFEESELAPSSPFKQRWRNTMNGIIPLFESRGLVVKKSNGLVIAVEEAMPLLEAMANM